jgi:SPP1 family predicted phage head-tail adaptor
VSAATDKISAGMLDQRLTLQQQVAGVDALGQPVGGWVTVATVACRARPLRSRELFAGAAMQDIADTEFTIRYRTGITAAWRVLWRGVPYAITGQPIDIDGQKVWLQLLASSGIRDSA